jgi:folate-binding protein YgfZ
MSRSFRVDLGYPAILEFRGPDAVRFLNGQMTQDVKLATCDVALPSCITDAKGKLQFRVHLTAIKEGVIWVTAPVGSAEELEGRLTKYLIADDVEVTDNSGEYQLYHLVGAPPPPAGHSLARRANRFGVEGIDLWVPVDYPIEFPASLQAISSDDLETFRIANGVPAWGSELVEGMLPPEAALEATDISYHKGCYIGQEVISRVKTAGKVNRNLVRLAVADNVPVEPGDTLVSEEGGECGAITSVAPFTDGHSRDLLGYLKRTADRSGLQVRSHGGLHPVTIR